MIRFLSTLIIIFAVGVPAWADWDIGDPHKMHFPQLPDPEGWDVNATFPKVIADDWMCSETGWVTDIHFWGSWREDFEVPIANIHLSIHDNIPEGPDGWSIPGDLLWEADLQPGMWVERFWGEGDQGWYDPNTGEYFEHDHFGMWQYNVFLPEDLWFWQEQDTIYWLDITVVPEDPAAQWGWKSSLDHWNDDAVWGDDPVDWWGELRDPINGESMDMAFVITPAPGALALLALAGLAPRRRRA
ncbi:MAG: hypothetical protein SYC29_17020 [Planctomycetota bacterium]|nr:hypothetical protein [Planctomycetota bacterium]